MKIPIVLVLTLVLFWISASQRFEAFILCCGLVGVLASVAVSAFLKFPTDTNDDIKISYILRFFYFIPWLFGQIWKSSVDVSACIVGLKKINPRISRATLSERADITALTCAAITLTPGTIVIDEGRGSVDVHSIHSGGAKSMEDGSGIDSILMALPTVHN